MATPHLLAFFFLSYIDNYIKQNVKAACWCRAVLLSQSCSKLCILHFADTCICVCADMLCCPHRSMGWWVTQPRAILNCARALSSAGFMEPFPRVAAAPACSSWCLLRTKNVWGCSPRRTSVFWAGKPSPAWWGCVLVEEHQVQTGILKSWAGIFVGKHINFYTSTTRCVRLCLSIAAQHLLIGRDLSFECIE